MNRVNLTPQKAKKRRFIVCCILAIILAFLIAVICRQISDRFFVRVKSDSVIQTPANSNVSNTNKTKKGVKPNVRKAKP